MGIFASGADCYIYDDNVNGGGTDPHVPGTPHTWAEINAAFPAILIRMDGGGNFFSATHNQYLIPNGGGTVFLGHPTAGNSNPTSLVDATGADIFSVGTRLQFPAANVGSQTVILGTAIGTGRNMGGKNGGTIHQSGALIFRGTVGLYGCHIETVAGANAIQFINGSSSYQEVAGCTGMATGSYVLGNAASGPLRMYNSMFASSTAGNVITSADINDSSGLIIAATSPAGFFASSNASRNLTRVRFTGAVTIGDVRVTGAGATNWNLTDVQFSETPGKPRVAFAAVMTAADGPTDFRQYETKVVDEDGNSLAGIPVQVSSDIDGAILDSVTDQDGNVVFSWPPTGQSQMLPVRDYYSTDGVNTSVRDRVFAFTINGDQAANPRNTAYEFRTFVAEWPGRDRLGTGYSPDGGSFLSSIDTISISSIRGTPWVEREVP